MTFKELGLIPEIQQSVDKLGYTQPTPIQEQAIPSALKGRDVLGCAQTGTGKTAAFSIPILQLLGKKDQSEKSGRHPRALILTPTRELAAQISESIRDYGRGLNLSHAVIFGGVSQVPQVSKLRNGLDILVATPGRLLDLMQQGHIRLDRIEFFVLDEADRMLDMGFIHDVKKILPKIPKERQTLFFSATMPLAIADLAKNILRNPLYIKVDPVSSTADTVQQVVYHVLKPVKKDLLKHLLKDDKMDSVLVFSRTKRGADRLARVLDKANIPSAAIHGDKSQGARERALSEFKAGKKRVLVATDIAARGIDIDSLAYVVNYDLPNEPETYVHRIGRTGRAGASGMSISMCDVEELPFLKDIEKLINKKIKVISDHPFPITDAAVKEYKEMIATYADQNKNRKRGGGGGGRGQSQGQNRNKKSSGNKKRRG
ncbi:MAG: DEAD/DEAH box helicase [Crocinitomicaceae bacterium]|nr:DEAD/DEAH box helicase [Crocinitomicaceae bacterium]